MIHSKLFRNLRFSMAVIAVIASAFLSTRIPSPYEEMAGALAVEQTVQSSTPRFFDEVGVAAIRTASLGVARAGIQKSRLPFTNNFM